MKQIHVFTLFGTAESFYDGQFRYLTDEGNEIILLASDGKGSKEFAGRNGIKFIPVSMPRAMSPVAILKAIWSICRVIKREKPQTVIGHTPVGALCAMIAAFLCRVRNRVYYRHGLIYTTMKGVGYYIFKMEERFVALLSTSVINVSHSLSRLAVKDKLNSDNKQHVIGHGTCGGIDAQNTFNPSRIDNDKLLNLKNEYHLHDDEIVFGYCGRLCIDKGTPELIGGFQLLKKKYPNKKVKLLLIGRPDERDILPMETRQIIEHDPEISYTDWVNKVEIPYYYSMLDVFVFPSHREGFGMVAIEASAMEKPLLVSKVHGCEDTIVEHVTGEYIPLTAEGICEGMELMLDADKRRFLGTNGRKNVLEWYDFRVMWPLVSELYKKILK